MWFWRSFTCVRKNKVSLKWHSCGFHVDSNRTKCLASVIETAVTSEGNKKYCKKGNKLICVASTHTLATATFLVMIKFLFRVQRGWHKDEDGKEKELAPIWATITKLSNIAEISLIVTL